MVEIRRLPIGDWRLREQRLRLKGEIKITDNPGQAVSLDGVHWHPLTQQTEKQVPSPPTTGIS